MELPNSALSQSPVSSDAKTNSWWGFKGRIGRLSYFYVSIKIVGFILVWTIVVTLASAYSGPSTETPGLVVGGYLFIFAGYFTLMFPLSVQRLHDINLAGAWVLLLQLPAIVSLLLTLTDAQPPGYVSGILDTLGLVVFLLLQFWPGTVGSNRFGDQPPKGSFRTA